MARVVVWNPHGAKNPRQKKALSPEQVEKRQAKAVRFLRDVVDDPDLADEIEDLSVREYAERKGLELINNPTQKRKELIPMKKDELKQAVKDGVIEGFKETRRSNPSGEQQVAPASTGKVKLTDRERKILDAVDDAAAAFADDDGDEALDILNGLLNRYDDETDSD
jgi:hypothetical protein